MPKSKTLFKTFCWVALVISLAACACNPAAKEKSPVLAALTHIDGEYVWNKKLSRHIYNKMALIETIVSPENPEKLMTILANCIDDSTPSRSTLNGKHLSLGVICYQALSQTAYYEPTDSTGDIKEFWPGHILPTANAQEMRAAKRAWLDVVSAKSYILY